MARDPRQPEDQTIPEQTADRPVFDRGEEDLPLRDDAPLNSDEEGNVLPGNDPLDEDPNDNGDQEQFDPEDQRRRRALGEQAPEQ